jgi:prolipoprotein diacylglyceryltransferase
MAIATIALAFDPILRVGDATVKLETVGLAVAILVALLLAGWMAVRTPPTEAPAGSAVSPFGTVPDDGRPDTLRLDDLIFIVLGILPGAIGGGRAGYVLTHLDFYRANPLAGLDPAQGSLELTLAVVGGTLTAGCATYLLGESIGRWLHVAAPAVLVAITLGKVAQALGGEGQGLPSDAPWATSYVGDGPWGSLAPGVPSHPAQLYEGGATFLVLVIVAWLLGSGAFDRRDGRAFLVAVALWLLARAAVATTWRDPPIAGALSAEQVLCLAVAAMSLVLAVMTAIAGHRAARVRVAPAFPDHEARPRF